MDARAKGPPSAGIDPVSKQRDGDNPIVTGLHIEGKVIRSGTAGGDHFESEFTGFPRYAKQNCRCTSTDSSGPGGLTVLIRRHGQQQ